MVPHPILRQTPPTWAGVSNISLDGWHQVGEVPLAAMESSPRTGNHSVSTSAPASHDFSFARAFPRCEISFCKEATISMSSTYLNVRDVVSSTRGFSQATHLQDLQLRASVPVPYLFSATKGIAHSPSAPCPSPHTSRPHIRRRHPSRMSAAHASRQSYPRCGLGRAAAPGLVRRNSRRYIPRKRSCQGRRRAYYSAQRGRERRGSTFCWRRVSMSLAEGLRRRHTRRDQASHEEL